MIPMSDTYRTVRFVPSEMRAALVVAHIPAMSSWFTVGSKRPPASFRAYRRIRTL